MCSGIYIQCFVINNIDFKMDRDLENSTDTSVMNTADKSNTIPPPAPVKCGSDSGQDGQIASIVDKLTIIRLDAEQVQLKPQTSPPSPEQSVVYGRSGHSACISDKPCPIKTGLKRKSESSIQSNPPKHVKIEEAEKQDTRSEYPYINSLQSVGGKVFVTQTIWQGNILLHIRNYMETSEGQLFPTRRGVAIPMQVVQKLVDILVNCIHNSPAL